MKFFNFAWFLCHIMFLCQLFITFGFSKNDLSNLHHILEMVGMIISLYMWFDQSRSSAEAEGTDENFHSHLKLWRSI